MPPFDVHQARAAMPITREWIHLNHAGVAPVAGPSADLMAEAALDAAHHSTVNSGRWNRLIEKGRVRFAQLVGTRPSEIAYVKNTSHGLLIAANGLPILPGDNVIFFRGEFPANAYPWLALQRKGVEARMLEPRDGRIAADHIREAMDARTRVVAVSFVQFGTGFRADLAAIGELCRERSAYFVVDIIQGAGALPLDLAACQVDIAAADGHKWLLGPEGVGHLYCRQDVLDDLGLSYVGWHSVESAWDFDSYDMALRPDARRFEEGSPTTVCAVGLAESAAILCGWGIPAVYARIIALTDRIIDHARRRGFQVLSPCATERERSGIVIVRPPDADPGYLVGQLQSRGVIAAARGGGIRFSPHAYNSEDEIDEAFTRLDSASLPS